MLLIFIVMVTTYAVYIPKEIVFPVEAPAGLQVTWDGCKEKDGCNVKERLETLVPYFNKIAAHFRPMVASSVLPQTKFAKEGDQPPQSVTLPEEPPEGSGLKVTADECTTDGGCDVKKRNAEIGKYFTALSSYFSSMVPGVLPGPHDTSYPMPVQSVNIPRRKIDPAKLSASYKNDIRNKLNEQNQKIYEVQKGHLKSMYEHMASNKLGNDPYHKYIEKVMNLEKRRQEMFKNYLKNRKTNPVHFKDLFESGTYGRSTGNPQDRLLEQYGGRYFTADGYSLLKKRYMEHKGLEGYGKDAFTTPIRVPLIKRR